MSGRPRGCCIYPVLMAADVLAYRAQRGAGGGGPARAHRAHARRRGGVQQALRRDARGARGQHPDGRRPRARPQGARAQDVDHGRHAEGHRLRRRGARVDRQEVQKARGRQRQRDRRARRQARHLEHDRDPGGRPRRHPGRHRARLRGLRLRRLQDRGRRGSRRVAGARSARSTWKSRTTRPYIESFLQLGRGEGPRDRRARSWPTCARRWASGPSAPPPSLPACASPSSSWTSTSSPVPSTCCSR